MAQEIDDRLLTDKQLRFAYEYIVDFDKTKAAIRAGYSKNPTTAAVQGNENYKKPVIKAKIIELLKARRQEYSVTDERLQTEIARIAFSDPMDIFKLLDTNKPISYEMLKQLPRKVTAAIKSVEPTKFGLKIVFHDKPGALDMLAKHLGYYEKDNSQKKAEGPQIYLPDNTRDKVEEIPDEL